MTDKRLLTIKASAGQLADWQRTAERAERARGQARPGTYGAARLSRHGWAIAVLDGASGAHIDQAITCGGPGVKRPTAGEPGEACMSLRVTAQQLTRWKRAAAQCHMSANRWYLTILDHASGRMAPLARQLARIAS